MRSLHAYRVTKKNPVFCLRRLCCVPSVNAVTSLKHALYGEVKEGVRVSYQRRCAMSTGAAAAEQTDAPWPSLEQTSLLNDGCCRPEGHKASPML